MGGRGLPRLAFLIIVTLAATSSGFSGLVIKYWPPYRGNPHTINSAYCVTDDFHLSLNSTVLPSDTQAVDDIDNTDTYKTVTWDKLDGVQGVRCSSGGKQDVIGPIIQHKVTLIPGRLSVTLNKDEDLLLRLYRDWGYSTSGLAVQWKLLSQNSGWNDATLTDAGELSIPSHTLPGSGMYAVIQKHTRTEEYGVFVVLVRECPAYRFGSDCMEWCPDCLHGGVCDARNGECVCPPGVTGNRCQTICRDGHIGRDCTVPLEYPPIRHVVCTSAPLGCTCAPGYHGYYCDTECSRGKWGADCMQTCRYCWNYCDTYWRCGRQQTCSKWGKCQGTQRRTCGEGDLGLPRLRQPPNVTSVTSQSAVMSFTEWRENYDDGELPSRGSLSYKVEYWPDGNRRRVEDVTPPLTTTLSNLEPATTYHVRVLVYVTVGGDVCSTQRGKVHTFQTYCPTLAKPEGFSSLVPSPASLEVRWKAVPYLEKCRFRYKLVVTSNTPGASYKTFYPTGTVKRVEGLTTNTEYTVNLHICHHQDKTNCSLPVSTTKRTIDEPGKVTSLRVKPYAAFLVVTWGEPADDPPKGELESFKVSWRVAGQESGYNEKVVDKGNWWRNSWRLDIVNLKPDTKYEIKVQAKNKFVPNYGAASITSSTTGVGVPSKVEDLKANGTESSLTLTWLSPRTVTGVTSWYNVSLYRTSDKALEKSISVTVTHAQFEGLSASQEYRARVAACNRQRCGGVQQKLFRTWPTEPHLEGTVDLATANDTAIVIMMPLLTNPPGFHFVLVQSEGRQPRTQEWKDTLKNTALNLVRIEDEKKQAHSRRSGRSAEQEEAADSEMYIAAKVLQEGRERLKVTVGENNTYERRYYNRPLKKDAAYWVVVVTEKRSGDYVKRKVSVPQRFVATPSVTTGMLVGVILGISATAVIIAVVVAIVIVYVRKRRSEMGTTPRLENDYNRDTMECEPWPENIPLPMVPLNDGSRNNIIEEGIYGNVTLHVRERDLEAYLLRAVTSKDTKTEFEDVPFFMSTTYSESDLPENRKKNRYRNKVTYDDTRVILPLYNGIPHSDYINANYVEGPTHPSAFIATQGPKEETVGAFWRMVWLTDCRVILMVANLREGQKVKVAQYWPEAQPCTVEGVTVTPMDVTVKMDFVIRTFALSAGNARKEVSQYQYTAWPDHGVPRMPYGLAQMIKLMRSDHPSADPVTVHCSAGIGRTGTVILVMYVLDQLQAHGVVNPSSALVALRRGRGRLVENTEQYIFAHQVLHEILFGLETSFPCYSFEDLLPGLRSPQPPDGVSLLQQQYKKLKSFPKDLSFKYGKDPACAYLNRNQDIMPADNRMVYVQGKGHGRDMQYINVVRINGVDQKDAYLAGEHPQNHTLGKMWRLVYERQVAVWVLVHTFPDDDPEFPNVVCESSALLGNMTLTASPTQAFQNYDERQVTISVTELGKVTKHQCLLISLRGWSAADNLPKSPEPLLAVIERVEALSSQHKQPPFFTCKDGATGCGVMAALLFAVSRSKLLQEVDIFRSVASVQYDRPEFVVNHEQYEFLHTTMAAFLNTNNLYGNFN